MKSPAQFFLIPSLVLLFFIPCSTRASEMFFNAGTKELRAGDRFTVDLMLNATGEDINAIEGSVVFPSDMLALDEVRDGNSIIQLWLQRPHGDAGKIVFSGIAPGGYKGEKGLVFSLMFLARREGIGRIYIDEARALRNDGKGTAVPLLMSDFSFSIIRHSAAQSVEPREITDSESPESFHPEIAQDPAVLNGKWFLVFDTRDKGAGIVGYEVKEVRQRIWDIFSPWIPAESPFVLRDQELHSYVIVKAVDKAGNTRVMELWPKNPLAWYEQYENLFMIMAGAAILVLFVVRMRLKKDV